LGQEQQLAFDLGFSPLQGRPSSVQFGLLVLDNLRWVTRQVLVKKGPPCRGVGLNISLNFDQLLPEFSHGLSGQFQVIRPSLPLLQVIPEGIPNLLL
jgi:hypothetical protein